LIRRRIRPWRVAGLGLLLLATAGCGKTSSLVEVTGAVTMDGKPVPGVVVSFFPITEKGAERLPESRGTTDESGKYTLTCVTEKPGAYVGNHKVVITYPQDRNAPRMVVIPAACMSIGSTPLEKTVVAGPNNIAIELPRQ
jgi:hypothetical protein